MTKEPIGQNRCPICGKDNYCGAKAGLAHGECWCDTIKIPRGMQALVPPELYMKACICKDCVDRYVTEHPDEIEESN